jgi:phospholipid/cholesterol/gamma-HCH transport system permease protein
MDTPADFSVEETGDARVLYLTGDWAAVTLGDAGHRLRDAAGRGARIDLTGVDRFDTAGAVALLRALDEDFHPDAVKARPENMRLLTLVNDALHQTMPEAPKRWSFNVLMDRLGRGLVGVVKEFYETMTFNGHLLVVVGRAILRPHKIRWASVTNVGERSGLDAIPIVAITTFFIGAVIGLLGVNMLADFGAQIFAVELIGIGVLREFAIVITAVLLAGRSASSFAAEIGAMKMQQEIDAMQVMGVDPFEALVLPRFLALLFAIPFLTFVANLTGLAGGMAVTWAAMDLSPLLFLQRMVENVGPLQFWLGMAKAPVMAIVIAGIGCRQGMEVGGDVDSLGRRVTTAVVHSIFSIILIDAIFALIYMQLDV